MSSLREIENILGTYTLEEILEFNDLTPAEALELLEEHGYVEFPEVKPL